MEFIAELKVRVQITARDQLMAQQVLKERHGCLIGGGKTAEAKDYFIRELRDFRSVLSGPTLSDADELPRHPDKDKVLNAKKAGVMHIHGVDVSMSKPTVSTTLSDRDVLNGVTEAVQLDLPMAPEPQVIEEPKPKFRRKSL